MEAFERPLKLRWADMDPNFHLRHSVYYDFGAQLRMEFLIENGLTPELMTKENFGPILFREECIFKKELRFGHDAIINLLVVAMRRDSSRFVMRHEIKRGDQVCAEINVDGAWIDTQKRKLTTPPAIALKSLEAMPKADDFHWLD